MRKLLVALAAAVALAVPATAGAAAHRPAPVRSGAGCYVTGVQVPCNRFPDTKPTGCPLFPFAGLKCPTPPKSPPARL